MNTVTHYTYRMTEPSGAVREETVVDCDTVEAYISRAFGSTDPAENGVIVELIAIDGQTPPSAEPAPAPVAPTPQPAPANSATDAPAGQPAVPAAPAPTPAAPKAVKLGAKK